MLAGYRVWMSMNFTTLLNPLRFPDAKSLILNTWASAMSTDFTNSIPFKSPNYAKTLFFKDFKFLAREVLNNPAEEVYLAKAVEKQRIRRRS